MKKLSMMIAAILVAGSAFAADSKLSGLNLRLGLFYPTDGDTRDATADTWFGGGLDYKLRDMTFGGGSMVNYSLGLSLDYFERDDVRVLPLLITLTGNQGQGIYWMAGAGFSFNSVPGEDETKFAYAIGLGYEFKSGMNPISFEVRYMGNSRSELSGVGAFVGFRF